MAAILLLNKPFNVLCQFTDKENRATLAKFVNTEKYSDYYPAGRLDFDSEGLLLLTNNGALQHRISHPSAKLSKTYWVQVEGTIEQSAINVLTSGVRLKDGLTQPAKAKIIASPPTLWERHPPIRERKNQATSWIELTISEGKNRQVRRMTAAVGYPTLRLIRASIGHWTLDTLKPGEFRTEQIHLPKAKTTRHKRPSASRHSRK